jgi:hypothetical protein
LCVDSRNELPEWFRSGQAEPLNANLTCRHTRYLQFSGFSLSATDR